MDGLKILLEQVEDAVETKINSKTEEVVADVKKQLEDLKRFTPTVVVKDGKSMGEMKGLQHRQLGDLVKLLGADLNVLMVGMAGTGKTHSAKQVADAIGLDFYAVSVGAQTSKSDLVGYMDANGNYVTTAFRKAYEQGGVFVMDEIDAGNSNVLIILNSALSNGIMSFPDQMIEMHEDFKFVATANTYGNGADRQYVGRNQLDSATLDRFTVIDWKIDEDLELAMVENYKAGEAWARTMREVRRYIEDSGIRAIVSPRATQKGSMLYEIDMTPDQMIEMTLLPQIPADKRSAVKEKALTAWTDNVRTYGIKEAKRATTPAVEAQTSTERGTRLEGRDGTTLEIRVDASGRKRYFKNNKLVSKDVYEKALAEGAPTTEPYDPKDPFDFSIPF